MMTEIVAVLREKGMTITTMESCTGGALASCITDVEGASEVFKGAYVAYSNEQKIRLGVSAETIAQYGVYSKETALAMAGVCREAFAAKIGIGITGTFSNPDPNNADSCAMVVYVAVLAGEQELVRTLHIPASAGAHGRSAMKAYVVGEVAQMLQEILLTEK